MTAVSLTHEEITILVAALRLACVDLDAPIYSNERNQLTTLAQKLETYK